MRCRIIGTRLDVSSQQSPVFARVRVVVRLGVILRYARDMDAKKYGDSHDGTSER